MAVLPKVRSALCTASQLPGEGPTDVEDAPTTDVNQNTMMTSKHRTITESHIGSNNQHRINYNRTTTLERTAAKATWGLKCI